jgi:class 3 adenylate cyclase
VVEQTAADVADGERKTVTALFADIKGSTELIRELDPEAARAIVDPILQLMRAAVHRFDGYVAQSTGDGIFAMFGAPVAHEDHPQRALHAALAIQEELRNLGEKRRAAGQPPLEARIGINTGEVLLRMVNTGAHTEYSPVGHAANLAARLQTVAPAGGVIVSEGTRKLVEDYFELRHLGAVTLRGIADPVNVYEVISAGPLRGHFDVAARRGLTKFVGRELSLRRYGVRSNLRWTGMGSWSRSWPRLGPESHGWSMSSRRYCRLNADCLKPTRFPTGKRRHGCQCWKLLKAYFRIETADDMATRREKVQAVQVAVDPSLKDTVPYLLGLLGIQEMPHPLARMDPQIRQQRTRDAIKRIVVSESLVQPVVVLFEDLHWIDGETQALLDLMADGIANARVLLLVNYRPEYQHQWANKSFYSQLRLESLEQESASKILAALLGESAELDALKHLMIERTQGNPFLIEEMVQALFDEGALVRNGTVKVARPLGQLRMPPTVQGILAARIDRLPTAEKDLLQTLAVVGRQAPLTVIIEIVSRPEIERMLRNLQAGEFIYEQAVSGTAVGYEFKHALTQEVAYNSVLIERRKILHERTAQALEALFVDSIDDHLGDLSFHYSHSGNDSRAIDYLIRAAEQASRRSGYSEAAAYLQQALTRVLDQPAGPDRYQRELAIHAGLAESAIVMSGYAAPEYEHHLNHRYELAQHLGDTKQIFYSLSGMSVLSAFRLELNKAKDIGWKLLGIADHEHDPNMQLQAHGSLANALWALETLSLLASMQSMASNCLNMSSVSHTSMSIG